MNQFPTALASAIALADQEIASAEEAERPSVQQRLRTVAELQVDADDLTQPHALQKLLQRRRYDAAMYLILIAGDLDVPDDNGATPLVIAAKGGRTNDYDMVEALLIHGADPMLCDPHGLVPLHYAAKSGSLPVVQLLVDRFGADVNVPRIASDGAKDPTVTPLAEAARNGHLRVMEYLENRGATVPVEQANALQAKAIMASRYKQLLDDLALDNLMMPDQVQREMAAAMIDSLIAGLAAMKASAEVVEFRRKVAKYQTLLQFDESVDERSMEDLETRAIARAHFDIDPQELA